ncbi:hypothetical protein [Corynebacterium lubricantis]|uniref:hypothetical protein n=1 Tax=Corynebacterium lubricantis TaxID=541095 RepID=UPI000362417E|nr:hypothetical protein [Corynebacterium lubricantis]
MRKRITAITVAATLTLGVAAPAPSHAFVQSAASNSSALVEDPIAASSSLFGLLLWGPFILSSMIPSFLGFEQCNLFDTRGCREP